MVAAVCRAAEDELSVKAVGSGHSFTDIAVTRGVMLDLDQADRHHHRRPHTGLVTVGAGTTLRELNVALWKLGLSLTNLGDIDAQTISGAIATGTHGTGRRLRRAGHPGARTAAGHRRRQAAGLLGRTSTPSCSPRPGSALGALGIITAVTLQCEPAFVLQAVEAPADYDDLLEVLGVLEAHDHFEFYWFPHTRRVLTKVQHPAARSTPRCSRSAGCAAGWTTSSWPTRCSAR